MTPNDAQIDLLLRRHAGQVPSEQGVPAMGDLTTAHLDADELNSFAEGSLPAAARARYVSHLADCDDCRRVASQLAISGGAVVAAEAKRETPGYSWWKNLAGLFSPFNLRYAAFAAVLVAVVGVAFLVTRQQRESNFIARNESTNQPQDTRAPGSAPPAGLVQAEKDAGENKSVAPSTGVATPMVNEPAAKAVENSAQPPPPPKPAKETGEETPVLAAKKAAEPVTVQLSPTYAPPPPGETARAGNVSTERREVQRNEPSAPRKAESSLDKAKVMDQSRVADLAKDNRAQDDSNRAGVNQSQVNSQRGADEKIQLKRDSDITARNRNERESQSQSPAPATQSAATGGRQASAEAPETRSAGGRKFTRQGNAWVDTKFKSSMYVKTISRGSTEFDALDSGLRSIARQLSGQLMVVWKNKAYLIR